MESTPNIASADDLRFEEIKKDLGLSDQDIEDHKGDARAIWEKTYHKFKEANESEYSGRRWFWELVQNAIDTLQNEAEKVDLTLEIEGDDINKSIQFTHNGGYFQHGKHIDDIDDFENFIRPGSSKSIGDNQKGGRFGTGFLSTHCLSPVIKVSGICVNADGQKYWNETTLDRSEITKEDALSIRISKLKITRQILDYKNNKRQVNAELKSRPSASFSYLAPINLKNLNDGLREIDHSLSMVFAFNPQLRTVTVINNKTKTTYVNKGATNEVGGDKIFETLITYQGESKAKSFFVLVKSEPRFDLAWNLDFVSGKPNIFLDLRSSYEETFVDNKPSLFCRYPLIGSGEFKFPIVINSKEFRPEEKRNGINLKEKNAINKELILLGVKAYKTYLVAHDSIQGQFNVVDHFAASSASLPEWIDKEWYKNVLASLKEIVLNHAQLNVSEKNTRALKNAKIPYLPKGDFDEKTCLRFYELARQLYPDQTSINQEEYLRWYNVIDFSVLTTVKYDFKSFLKDIEKIGDLDALSKRVDNPIQWLREAIILTIEIDKDQLDHNSIIPNQTGAFDNTKDEIHYNDDIELKDSEDHRGVLLECHELILRSDFEQFLLHEDFEGIVGIIPSTKRRNQKDLIKIIDDSIRDADDRRDSKFVKALQFLFQWLNSQEDSDLKKAFSYLSAHKPDLYFNTFSDTERDLAFTIVQSNKLESLSKLAASSLTNKDINSIIELEKTGVTIGQMSQLARLSKSAGIEKAIQSVKDLARENEEKEFKREIGERVEPILNAVFSKEFPNYKAALVRIKEYDILITNKLKPLNQYYIELKSINETNEEPIKMGIHQARMAKDHPNNYALLLIHRPSHGNLTEDYLRANILCDYQIGKDVIKEVEKADDVDVIVKSLDSIKLEIKDPTMKVQIRQQYIEKLGKTFDALKTKIHEAIK